MADRTPIRATTRNDWWAKRRPGRLKTSMIGLSTAAILSVYAAGYASSDDAGTASDASLAAITAGATPATTTTAPAQATTSTSTPRTGASGAATAAPTATPAPATTSGAYADGTYTGSGTSRHGGMTVTVVVEGGTLVSAEITGCNTRYPCSRISALPAKVLASQQATTDYVSGATDSSRAFMQAVAAALVKAKA